jgi:excisionase family DNA binding protein
MITPNQAAAIAGVSSRTIYRWIEESKIHFTEDSSELILVCVPSIGAAEA